jgi:DNA-binding beta-propeller fold protein YncE
VAGAWLLGGQAALALPLVVEAGWTLVRTDTVEQATSAHYNPVDGHLYVASLKRLSDGGGVFRVETDGSLTRIADANRPRAVVIDPVTGDVFHSEAGSVGAIYRTAFGAPTPSRELWVHGFHDGDDDPIGMAIAPLDYTGGVLEPGAALVVDEGNGGPAEVWAWTPFAIDCSVSGVAGCRNEYAVHTDDGSTLAPTDITIGRDGVYLVDWGQVFEVMADGSAVAIPTLESLFWPSAIAVDPLTGDLFVMEAGPDGRIVRVDPDSGAVSVVIEGFTFNDGTTDTTGLDVSPDGQLLFVTERLTETVYTFATSGGVAVAEPATAALLGAGLAALARRRRRA